MPNQTPESVIAEVIEYHADTIGSHYYGCHKHHAPCLAVKLRDMLREPGARAIDEAPEPEWEYGYRGRYAVMHPTKAGQRIETPEITQRTPDNWLPEMGEIYRRRPSTPAGPWEPIKGESE